MRQHRQHQQDAQAARDAAAGIEDEADRERRRRMALTSATMRRLDQCSRRAMTQQHGGGEIGDARREKQGGAASSARPQCGPGERLHGDQHQRNQQPIEIEQPDHAPGEIARCHGWGGDAGRRCRQASGGRLDQVRRNSSTFTAHRNAIWIARRRLPRVADDRRDLAGTPRPFSRTMPAFTRQQARPMNLHEYQAKEIFRSYGIPVPAGQVAASARGGRGGRAGARRQRVGRQGPGARRRPRQGRRRQARARPRGGARRGRGRCSAQRLVTKQTGPEGLPDRAGLRRVRLRDRARDLPVA